jgi:uncharacterized lipoprotein YddW (UPF0748 family)
MRLLLLSTLLAQAAPRVQARDVRAIWVTRFEYSTEAEVREIVRNSAALGFNTILFQVRGQADAYYKSRLEPWAERLGGRDPGFDPLEAACAEAKRRGVQLHAWINVLPLWRGKAAPADRSHAWHRRPEWLLVGKDGKRQALNDHYVCANPCLPAVRAHLAEVARDLVSRYPVDGLHLDYIRFIEGDWSYDPATLRLFGGSPAKDPAGWERFKRDAVTQLVRSIRTAVRAARPEAVVSAAVFPTAKGRALRFQDAEAWARQGLVDWVFPMTYEDSSEDFEALVGDAARDFPGAAVLPGVGAYRHARADLTARQIRACPGGFALFSYSSLYVSPDAARQEDARLCGARREAVRRLLAR